MEAWIKILQELIDSHTRGRRTDKEFADSVLLHVDDYNRNRMGGAPDYLNVSVVGEEGSDTGTFDGWFGEDTVQFSLEINAEQYNALEAAGIAAN